MKLPSKFYLYYYGLPGFIVDLRINNNFRYGQNESDKFSIQELKTIPMDTRKLCVYQRVRRIPVQ